MKEIFFKLKNYCNLLPIGNLLTYILISIKKINMENFKIEEMNNCT